MDAWWGSLDTSLQVFYAIGIGSSAVLLIQAGLMVFGLDGNGDTDLGHDLDHGHGGTSILSVRTITAFLVGFGWTGVAAIEAGYSAATASAAGFAVGSLFMGGVILMMRLLYSMASSGTLDYQNAVGVTGTVYLPIPAKMERPGQIEIMVQGRLQVVSAFTRATGTIPRHARVRVVELVDATSLLVEPVET